MNDSKLIWFDELGHGRNLFGLFLRRFHLAKVPATVPLHVFADGLYRLRVNGRIVGFGPARFLPAYPEYDSYDLARFLHAGDNTVLVEVHSRGMACFQAVSSRGGFIAGGRSPLADGGELDFATPGDWLACRAQAWHADTETFSFAQGPIEILDHRRLPAGYPGFADGAGDPRWHRPATVAEATHWGQLAPRAIPMPSLEKLVPKRIVLAAAVKGGPTRHGFNAANPEAGGRQPFFTHIFSPSDQEVELGVFWGPLFINGHPLEPQNCPERGNRQSARVRLRAGWNFVYGLPEMLRACWTWLMELPEGAGLRLRALPADDCDCTFALGAPQRWPRGAKLPPAPHSLTEIPDYPAAWRQVTDDLHVCSPTRELAWDSVGETWRQDHAYEPGLELPANGEAATVVLDFGREYIGHLHVEFETEHGAVLDAGYEERLNAARLPAYFSSNPFVNSADRYRIAAGRQEIDAYHERGGRYLQLTFRGRPGRVRIHRVEMRQKIADNKTLGSFRCDDPLFNWTWETGVETVRVCMNDGWTDCPWRERGMYIGDVLVSAPATRKFARDWRMEPWAIRLWARAQYPNGQLPDVVPSEQRPLCDYTLLWIVLLRNYWAATGDAALVREVWPAVGRIFRSSVWKTGLGGLWEVHPGCVLFVDWGITPEDKLGVNGVLNAFRFRALQCAAELAEAIGLPQEGQAYASEAESVRAAFHEVLWDDRRQQFAACVVDGRLSESPAAHVNALALAYGLAQGTRQAGVLASLRQQLRHNALCQGGHLELYFLTFLLQGLYRVGECALAEEVIRGHYRLMRDRGAWTFWESLKAGLAGRGSLCHGWSAGPLIFFSERVLGVREELAGDSSRMVVSPESATLNEAAGIVPHPRGLIHVAWRIEENKLLLALRMPDGVTARIAPAGRLAALELVRVSPERMTRHESCGESPLEAREIEFAGSGG